MDILVLDAPMKFIHGKMIEQGAKEWSRYLTSQFNPIGRGTLYSEQFDKETGLKVFLYSANITLECVGESKGYLKVVKAQETDVITYHKMIEEGKLLEEKITFVPVYKFQYINGKEHHDVERFMQDEQGKRALASYMEEWENLIADEEALSSTAEEGKAVKDDSADGTLVKETLKKIYVGKTANKEMRSFMPDIENLKAPMLKEFESSAFTMHYELLNAEQKEILASALSTDDLYFVDTQYIVENKSKQVMPLIKEMVQQVTGENKRVLVVAPESHEVEEILHDLESESIEAVQIQQSEENQMSKYALEYKMNHMKESVLNKLNEEASKHNRHKEELDQMKKECELYQTADKTIKLSFEILDLLQETEVEKAAIMEESKELGLQGMAYAETLERYEAIPQREHEVYQKLKQALGQDEGLYEEMLWMKMNEGTIHYDEYKELILEYSTTIQAFEEKLKTYKAQIAERNKWEEDYKALELQLLELRRQHLKTEALKQVDLNGTIETNEEIEQQIHDLEERLQELSKEKNKAETGIVSTRYLDELKVKVYELKEKVEAYLAEYKAALSAICSKEEITKADVIQVFKRMQKVEGLFEEDEAYAEYLEGLQTYFEMEVIVHKNEKLIELQDVNHNKMGDLLKKQQEINSLLSTKLEEVEFRSFLKLVEDGEILAEQILRHPLSEQSKEALEKLEAAVQQRAFKLQIYKEKVDFYEELVKLKTEWQQSLMEDKDLLRAYLMEQVKVVGTTCHAIGACQDVALGRAEFEYIIITDAHRISGLEMLIPMIHGKKGILIGDAVSHPVSLFARLYKDCPKENKNSLEILA